MNDHKQTTHQDLLINLLFDGGLQNALPRIAEMLMNAAMLLERENHIGAAPYQRRAKRNDYANGFKPRSFQPKIRSSNEDFHRKGAPCKSRWRGKGEASVSALRASLAPFNSLRV